MTVAEFIIWLQGQDQGATVQVMVQQRAPNYAPWGECEATPFDPEQYHAEYSDARQPWAKGQPYEGERTLTLGTKD